MTRRPWQPGAPLLGLVTTLVALGAWSGMVERPGLYLLSTGAVGLVLVLVGSLLRARGLPAYAVLTCQLALGVVGLDIAFAGGRSILGVVPTWSSLRELDLLVADGAATLNYYAAPVAQGTQQTAAMLTACGLAVVLGVDLLAAGLRRPALAALPLLTALAVPIAILDSPLTVPVFAVAGLLFVRLLATGRAPQDEPASASPAALWQVGVGAVVLALLAAPLVPIGEPWRNGGSGAGAGQGGGIRLDVVNPIISLRRDLVEQRHVPLLYATTEARRTSYLTTTVLDRFTSEDWRPSARRLPAENTADGLFPNPPGLATTLGSTESQWSLQFAPAFRSPWLPLPAPVRQVAVPGDWRYDSRTLDVARVGAEAPGTLSYAVTAFEPAVTAQVLRSALPAPAALRRQMTAVPSDLPPVIERQARSVTRGARTDYDKAVALQDWFRTGGGFTYSLDQRGGSGMQLLADFVTTDRIGYCEQYAAAMAAMGRTLGIPSRVAVGFLDGEREADGRILYTSDARHAWPEMYFSGAGWVRFEPTPSARARTTPSYTREEARAPSAAPTPSATPTPRASQAPTPEQTAAPETAPTTTHRSWLLPLVALAVVALLLVPALLRRRQRRRRLERQGRWHLAEGAWAELRATALDLGLRWPDDRSPREQARAVTEQVGAPEEDVRGLQTLLVEVERGRYAASATARDEQAAAPEAERTRRTVDRWREAMEDSVTGRPSPGAGGGAGRAPRGARRAGVARTARRWRSRLLPASLLDRRRR